MGIKLAAAIVTLLSLVPTTAGAAAYRCTVEKKFDPEISYTQEHLKESKFSVLVDDHGTTAFLSRCSFAPSVGKIICDRYEVDRIAFDNYVKIKKYYNFHSHFDVQIFSNLSFIENNGRGGIAFGTCTITSP